MQNHRATVVSIRLLSGLPIMLTVARFRLGASLGTSELVKTLGGSDGALQPVGGPVPMTWDGASALCSPDEGVSWCGSRLSVT